MGYSGRTDTASARTVAEFIHRQLSTGYLTENWGADDRQVEAIREVRGGNQWPRDKPSHFEIKLASGQYFKVTVEEQDE